MKTITINKTFSNHQELDKWEKENLQAIAKENGGVVFMVNHEAQAGSDEIILKDVILL